MPIWLRSPLAWIHQAGPVPTCLHYFASQQAYPSLAPEWWWSKCRPLKCLALTSEAIAHLEMERVGLTA
eukprot:612265-Karenia_brevis.AAC.1